MSAYDPYSKRTYKQEQKLVYKKKTFSAFIQTDKAMYKAGDLVNFRVFAIDSETKPHNVEGGSITITDSGSAKIKSFADVKFVKGKYESSLQLSESPTLGNWKISFAANGDVSFWNHFKIIRFPESLKSLNRYTRKKLKYKNMFFHFIRFASIIQLKLQKLTEVFKSK